LKNYYDIYIDTYTGAITSANERGYFGDDAAPTEYNRYVKNTEDIVSEDSSKE